MPSKELEGSVPSLDSINKFQEHPEQHHKTTMPPSQMATRTLARYLQTSKAVCDSARSIRCFTSTPRTSEEAVAETASSKPPLDPATTATSRGEKALMKSGVLPIGSRRRRIATRTSDNIPFEQLPYHCFQEARKVLQADREEKLKLIQTERLRISNLLTKDPSTISGGEKQKQTRLESMRRHLEYLKIQADINDPLIKKRFEDGDGMHFIRITHGIISNEIL